MLKQGGIVLTKLSKSYGPVRAVRSIDLMIAPGETVALLGPNGAGKTTAIDMVLGLTRPDSGSVSLFGRTPARAVADGALARLLQTGSPLDHMKGLVSCPTESGTAGSSLTPTRPEPADLRRVHGPVNHSHRDK